MAGFHGLAAMPAASAPAARVPLGGFGMLETFSLSIRQGSQTGTLVESRQHLGAPTLRTKPLTHGHCYS